LQDFRTVENWGRPTGGIAESEDLGETEVNEAEEDPSE